MYYSSTGRGKKVAAVLSSAEFSREAEYLAGFAAEVTVYCKAALPPFAVMAALYLLLVIAGRTDRTADATKRA